MRKDLTRGPVFKTLFLFSLPLIVTNLVSILFHAADVTVLSLMSGDAAVAAVGACGPLITLLVTFFNGFATGANVIVARRVGARDEEGVRRAVGTAMILGLSSGIILMVVALIFSRQFLIWMNCQEDVLDMAVLYMQIYFLGMPATMLYGFVAAVLRASGDSMRPMVYMLVSGVVNVGLNVLFVGAFGLSVAGVAIATTLSNLLSLILGLAALIRSRGPCRIVKAHLRFRFSEFIAMLRIAVPASLGGLCFFVSNIFISATVNAMSTDAMTANAISGQFDGVIYTVGAAIAVATMNMVGQSLGAQNPKRIKKSLAVGALYGTVASISLGVLFVCFSEPMLYILTDSANVVAIAKDRMTLLCLTYFITTVMEVFSFSLNALHRQTAVMAVCGICGFGIRSAWTFFVYPLAPSLSMLYTSFAVSAGVAIVCYLFITHNTFRRLKEAFVKEEAPVAVKL